MPFQSSCTACGPVCDPQYCKDDEGEARRADCAHRWPKSRPSTLNCLLRQLLGSARPIWDEIRAVP